ncbi:putative OsmC-like protein [Balneicella halophila]|uniref:Putative OsmC-like protein n=1 Tax=Balneicella halophila TaxID=1537566 RepID=A0A7L4UPR9_BALHA|nr:OsmC family protein [Balneicella halophila]PVX50877.1 putative OsmC-like protein [Balneicella halophila]
MGKFKSTYKGNLRVESVHLQSGSTIETDAPTDNNGKGERFSPTDLVATALANCMLTIMGMKAEQMTENIDGTTVEIEKIMASAPRRIREIRIDFYLPKKEYDSKTQQTLEAAALSCPVAKSLNPAITQVVTFHWE